MNFNSFKESLQNSTPPEGISPYLKSLWYDGKNDWEMAHNIIQDIEDASGSWIHAYLHRKEGDIWNADYWYRKANKKRPDISLEQEWELLIRGFITHSSI